MKTVEAIMQIKRMKIDEPLTRRQWESIRFFLGEVLDKIPEPQNIGSAYFNGNTVLKTGVLASAEITTTEETEGVKEQEDAEIGLRDVGEVITVKGSKE